MKTLIGRILSFIGLGLTILFGFIFAFIELRTLFAGDYSLFNNPVLGFFAYFFRSVFFLGLIAESITLIIFISKKKEEFLSLLIISGGLFISAFMGLFFYAWFVAALIILISLFPVLISLLNFLKKK